MGCQTSDEHHIMNVKPEDKKFFKSKDGQHVWAEGLGHCKCGTMVLSHALWLNHLEQTNQTALLFQPTPKDFCAGDMQGEHWPKPLPEPAGSRMVSDPKEGRKNDNEKFRYDLIPPGPLNLVAEVYTIGARKYDDRNWEKGIKWGRIFAAMMRHAWAFWRGEQLDPVDGQHHLASVVWCAFALMEYETTHPELDNRAKR